MIKLDDGVCKLCGKAWPEVTPYFQNKDGKNYYRPFCKECDNSNRLKYRKQPTSLEANQLNNLKRKQQRKSELPLIRASIIIKSSTRVDKKKGRVTNLPLEQVAALITKPCTYCGDTSSLSTLDRIDNSKGHTIDNVLPACLRCNITRGAMPYEAWLVVSKGMCLALESGLFKDWNGKTIEV